MSGYVESGHPPDWLARVPLDSGQPGDGTRLRGMRLGKLERHVLLHAAHPDFDPGQLLDALRFGRSTQAGLLRAIGKLEQWGLIESAKVAVATRVVDRRKHQPIYRHGAFWLRRDPRRWHVAYRKVVWQTPFGAQIVAEFRDLLEQRLPIRWDERRVALAARRSRLPKNQPDLHSRRIATDEFTRDATRPDERAEKTKIVAPSFVRTAEDWERWRLCVRLGRRQQPKVGSQRLWEHCRDLYQDPMDGTELRRLLGLRPDQDVRDLRRPSDRFLALPVLLR